MIAVGGRGSGSKMQGTGRNAVVVTDGRYPTVNMRSAYSSEEQMRDAGFVQQNDFSLSALLDPRNTIGVDAQPWNGVNKYYVWDVDFKRWLLAAEWRY